MSILQKGVRADRHNRGAAAADAYRGGRRARRLPPARPAHVLAPEDLLLAVWFLALEQGLVRVFGADPLMWLAGQGLMGPGQTLSPGSLTLGALLIFLVFTRGPADTSRDEALARRTFLLGPALPILSIYSLVASAVQRWWYLRSRPHETSNEFIGPAHPVFASDPPWPGPRVSGLVRRSLALPVALIGDAMFRAELRNADLVDISNLDLKGTIMVLATVAPFVLFVAGPRLVAGDTRALPPWALRFALFWAAPLVGARLWG
jgi:hypothetical protein